MTHETYTVGIEGRHEVYFLAGPPSLHYPFTREDRIELAREYLELWIDEKIIDPMTLEVMEMLKSDANDLCRLGEKELYELVIEAVKKVGGIK